MNALLTNPHALYVYCDAAMNYNTKSTGGVGFEIVFPDFVGIVNIKESIGKYVGANIERLELEAIIQGMNEVVKLFRDEYEKLKNINTIIFITDRYGLNDQEKTSAYRIRDWRRNKWHSHEGKAIKNSDLLDKLDKTRTKIADTLQCRLFIQYGRRKYNKSANNLAKAGKEQPLVKDDIALKGSKIGRRKYDGGEVNYSSIKEREELQVHVFKKDPVREQWEISVEICKGVMVGKKLKIYSDDGLASKLSRFHVYRIRVKKAFSHHITIFRTLKELKKH